MAHSVEPCVCRAPLGSDLDGAADVALAVRAFQLLREWDGHKEELAATRRTRRNVERSRARLSHGLRGDEGNVMLWELAALAQDAAARHNGWDGVEQTHFARLLAHYSKVQRSLRATSITQSGFQDACCASHEPCSGPTQATPSDGSSRFRVAHTRGAYAKAPWSMRGTALQSSAGTSRGPCHSDRHLWPCCRRAGTNCACAPLANGQAGLARSQA